MTHVDRIWVTQDAANRHCDRYPVRNLGRSYDLLRSALPPLPSLLQVATHPHTPADKIEVVNQLAQDHVLTTVRKYGVNYDSTWSVPSSPHYAPLNVCPCLPGTDREGRVGSSTESTTRSTSSVPLTPCKRYRGGTLPAAMYHLSISVG